MQRKEDNCQCLEIRVLRKTEGARSTERLWLLLSRLWRGEAAPLQSDLTIKLCYIPQKSPPNPFTPSTAIRLHSCNLGVRPPSPLLLSTLLPSLLHPQNLHHPYEDVQKVEFQADTLIHHILPR